MSENSRTINELISLYTLESDIIDFYVEGINDKFLIDSYVDYKKLEIKTIEIGELDFTGIDFQELDFKSNKDKVILLTRILSEYKISSNVKCLIDTDLDGILKAIESNDYLVQTDYCCMESYYYCEKILGRFIEVGIREFSFKADFILNEIAKVLRGLFMIRLIKLKFNFNCNLLKIENNLVINKDNGKIEFNFEDYLSKFIIANGLTSHKSEILEFITEINERVDSEIKNTMNGHDFIEVLFLFVNKIKSSLGFKFVPFERAFLLSLQPNHFDGYPLFDSLEKFGK